jgi:signal transduction histidine kinase
VPTLFLTRLVACAAGTLAYFFLIALVLGHRRPRTLERLLFFLLLSLFLLFSGGLLAINSELHYDSIPGATRLFYSALITAGLLFFPPLLVHFHFAYARLVGLVRNAGWTLVLVATLYAWACVELFAAIRSGFAALTPADLWSSSIPARDQLYLMCSLLIGGGLQWRIARSDKDSSARRLFASLASTSFALLVVLWFAGTSYRLHSSHTAAAVTFLLVLGILPAVLLIYHALRYNFLEFGAQRNLVYALPATFLALLYLALVRRVSGWLEPILPPEATASVLLFALLFLFEPLERAVGPFLQKQFRHGLDHIQRLTPELQQEARQGDLSSWIQFAERRIREEFGLSAIRISVPRNPGVQPLRSPGGLGDRLAIPLLNGGAEIGLLEVASTGVFLTGETSAALQFLAEQLPGAIDLCRLIEEKLRLERELASRERLAMLGHMAASVSHNLRNPLSSMKTILQVQLENQALEPSVRNDSELVLGEIDRMNLRLEQLLRYAKPSVRSSAELSRVELVSVADRIIALLARDADRRNVPITSTLPKEPAWVAASQEALTEIVSNLVVNAVEAQPNGGQVNLAASVEDGRFRLEVVDCGPGITPEVRAKIFQPFFTTKPRGTGLGLAIVMRRLEEIGGTISCESPVSNGRGTRFVARLPLVTGES